jgi:hypothetical protein
MGSETIAIGDRLDKVPAGVDEQHGSRRIDCRHEMKQYCGLCSEGGDDGDLA